MTTKCKVKRPFGSIGSDMVGKTIPVTDPNRVRLLVNAGYVERVEETAVTPAVEQAKAKPVATAKKAVVTSKRKPSRRKKTTARKKGV